MTTILHIIGCIPMLLVWMFCAVAIIPVALMISLLGWIKGREI